MNRQTNRKEELKAVIFDLDGVIADSHPLHERAWTALLVEQGLNEASLNLDFLYAGHPRRAILRHYLGALDPDKVERLGRHKDELYAAISHELQPKPGILLAVRQLRGEGILCALATSAGRGRTVETLTKFEIAKQFAVVVTGEDAGSPKPAADIFLLAAAKLDVEPRQCVVVEDSVAGVAAARAAGMKCVGFAAEAHWPQLADAGASDLIREFPADAPGYFRGLVAANGRPAAGVHA